MPEKPWVRVKDKRTGHHISVKTVIEDRHQVLKQDAVDRRGNPLPPKPRVASTSSDTTKKAAPSADTSKKETSS